MLHQALLLLQENPVPPEGRPLMRLLWLWAALAVLGLVLLGIFGWSRRRWRSQFQGTSRKRPRPIKDAWREAGRRVEPPSAEQLEDREGPG